MINVRQDFEKIVGKIPIILSSSKTCELNELPDEYKQDFYVQQIYKNNELPIIEYCLKTHQTRTIENWPYSYVALKSVLYIFNYSTDIINS